jgi:hypothetical protein
MMDVTGGMDGVNAAGLAVTLLADNESPLAEKQTKIAFTLIDLSFPGDGDERARPDLPVSGGCTGTMRGPD